MKMMFKVNFGHIMIGFLISTFGHLNAGQDIGGVSTKVQCFNVVYYAAGRSCHELQLKKARDWVDCCVVRAEKNYTTNGVILMGGYASGKDLMDASVPTYHCTPCEQVIEIASPWTEWSECNKRCGGGARKRSRICDRTTYHYGKLCYEISEEFDECNLHPCNENLPIFYYILISVLGLIVLLLMMIWLCRYLQWRKFVREERRYPSVKEALCFICCCNTTRRSKTLSETFSLHAIPDHFVTASSTPQTPRYHLSSVKRTLPVTPTGNNNSNKFSEFNGEKFLTEPIAKEHTYEELADYIPMTKTASDTTTYSNMNDNQQ